MGCGRKTFNVKMGCGIKTFNVKKLKDMNGNLHPGRMGYSFHQSTQPMHLRMLMGED